VIAETWDLRIFPTFIRGEVHEAHWIIQDFTKCFTFILKELGQLWGEEV